MPADEQQVTLVAWDGSEPADRALAWAAAHTRRCGGRAIVVHVVPPMTLSPPAGGLPRDLLEDQRAAVERTLRETAQHAAKRQGLTADVEIVASLSPGEAILEAVQRHRAEIICLGSHGRGGVARQILGSVADRVLRRSEIPVLLVP